MVLHLDRWVVRRRDGETRQEEVKECKAYIRQAVCIFCTRLHLQSRFGIAAAIHFEKPKNIADQWMNLCLVYVSFNHKVNRGSW